ncbi:MAG: hypothetical protein K8U03_12760 [Planctomycetia bacterium]|nr:hypothetical protein [Planctomycetia bacterium]
MNITTLEKSFDERVKEIESYLDLLDLVERQLQHGPPEIDGSALTTDQQRILYSSVYLQLYNLVEATATWCVDAVTFATSDPAQWHASQLASELRREWVRAQSRSHVDLNYSNRLQAAVELCDCLIAGLPIGEWSVEKGYSGSWDDAALESISVRLGFNLSIRPEVYRAVKQPIREGKGALGLVKYFRNRLAHGSLSFAECGDAVTSAELRDLATRTSTYLRDVVSTFRHFIEQYQFLAVEFRPSA